MIEIVKKNHIVCQECGNADSNTPSFFVSNKLDDRLSKDNLKFYKVVSVYGGGQEFSYPKISLKVGDVVMTEAIGIDIEHENQKYKVFDTDFIVAKVMGV